MLTDLKCEETCVNDAFLNAYDPEHAMYLIFEEEQCCLDSSSLVNITVSNSPFNIEEDFFEENCELVCENHGYNETTCNGMMGCWFDDGNG